MPVKLAVLFSGGKDSVFACYRAMETDEVACLISLISENEESYMFHTPNIKWTSKLAEAMGLPILSWKTRGEKESELDDLEDAISLARDRFGIEGVVTGAIESVYQATRVQKICKSLDLWCFNPLWQINQLDYLRLLLSEGFEVMISGVFAYPLDESWVGAMLSEDLIQKLERLSSRYKINPSGEGGELETFVLDCPIFEKRVAVTNSSRSYENYRGQLTILDMRLEDKRLEDIELARRRPEDRVQEDQAQIGKVQLDKVQLDKVQADKGLSGKSSGAEQILVVDLCYKKSSLSRYEFVYPVADALMRTGSSLEVVHCSDLSLSHLDRSDRIVLCGTALKDNSYSENLGQFSWLLGCRKPVLGICAGMQVIAAAFGGKIVPQPAIGLLETEVLVKTALLGDPRRIECYQLHNFGTTLPDGFDLLSGVLDCIDAIKHSSSEIYGISFHPEVRNRWILENFSRL